MVKIALVPIDNRPVCYDLPKMIGNLDLNNEIFMPDINYLGDIKKNANVEALFAWLEKLKETEEK